MVNLPNIGIQLINIIAELCDFCTGLLGSEVYCNGGPTVWILCVCIPQGRASGNCSHQPRSRTQVSRDSGQAPLDCPHWEDWRCSLPTQWGDLDQEVSELAASRDVVRVHRHDALAEAWRTPQPGLLQGTEV